MTGILCSGLPELSVARTVPPHPQDGCGSVQVGPEPSRRLCSNCNQQELSTPWCPPFSPLPLLLHGGQAAVTPAMQPLHCGGRRTKGGRSGLDYVASGSPFSVFFFLYRTELQINKQARPFLSFNGTNYLTAESQLCHCFHSGWCWIA